MTKYRKKPVEVEAEQWSGCTSPKFDKLIEGQEHKLQIQGTTLFIATLEGEMVADQGDYVIKGIRGELYPCKPDIFKLTYDEVE